MNELEAIVNNIENVDDLNLVEFDFNGTILTMMSLHLNNVFIGSKVKLNVSSSHIMIAKNYNKNISVSNAIEGKIINIEEGKLLNSIKVAIHNTFVTCITTNKVAKNMNLKISDNVIVLIKASQLAIKEVIK